VVHRVESCLDVEVCPNDNTDRLITYCGMHNLTILGSPMDLGIA